MSISMTGALAGAASLVCLTLGLSASAQQFKRMYPAGVAQLEHQGEQ